MNSKPSGGRDGVTRRAMAGIAVAAPLLAAPPLRAQARPKLRVGLATRTWWPSVVAETAIAQGLFAKAGIDAETTIYRSGGDAVEALAAGATDIITGLVTQVGPARRRGVNARLIALAATANTGWKLLVRSNSPIRSVAEIAGRKVGITAAGSLSDFMALWSRAHFNIDFASVPLGGGGLVPNLLSGNVDAAIVYSPLSFQVIQAGQARELVDYATLIPPHLATGWVTTDAVIARQGDTLRAGLRAIYGAVAFMQRDRDAAVRIIADVNGIPPAVALQEHQETFMKLSPDGRFTLEQVGVAIDLARIGGFRDLPPAAELVSPDFTPVTPSA